MKESSVVFFKGLAWNWLVLTDPPCQFTAGIAGRFLSLPVMGG
jgi:hypothetical protein